MTITPHSFYSRQKKSLLTSGLSLLSLVGLLAPSLARADVMITVDKGQNSSMHAVTTSSSSSSGGSSGGSSSYGGGSKGGSKGGSGGGSTTESGSTFYTITARNTLDLPVKGVVVEYHVYNRTTATSSTGATVTVDDITDSVTIDLDSNGSKQVETKDIPHTVTNTASSGGGSSKGGKGGKGGTTTTGGGTSSVQSVMGWVIYLEFKGKKVRTYTSSDTLLDDVAKINKQNGS